MTIRATIDLNVYFSSDPTASEGKDRGEIDENFYTDTPIEGGTFDVVLPPATVDEEVGLYTSATVVCIKTNKEIDIKLNLDTNTAITIAPPAAGKPGVFLVTTSAVTKIFITTKLEETIITIGKAGL